MAPEMKSALQRILVVVVALSLAPWAQGEICPMKMQSRLAEACGPAGMHAHHAAHAAAKPAEHDCCPQGQTSHTHTQQQCPPVQLSACDATMTCCSIDQQPSSSPQAVVAPQQPVVIAVMPVTLSAPLRAVGVATNLGISVESSVFRLKEDLRI